MVLKPGTAAAASADARGIACMADETHDTAGMAAATQAQQAPTQTEAAAPSSHKQPSSVAELVDAGRAAAAVRDANTRAQSQQQRLSDLVAAEHPITDERLYSHKPHGEALVPGADYIDLTKDDVEAGGGSLAEAVARDRPEEDDAGGTPPHGAHTSRSL